MNRSNLPQNLRENMITSKKMKKQKERDGRGKAGIHQKKTVVVLGCLFLLILIVLFWVFVGRDWLQKKQDIRQFAQKSYSGVFLGTYDLSGFEEEDFAAYRGVPVLKAEYTLKNWKDVSDYLSQIFSSGNEVTNLYLGLDPKVLWNDSGRDEERWGEDLEKHLLTYIRDHQNITCEILLPAPSLQYWTEMDAAPLQETLEVYNRLALDMTAYANVSVYFMGGLQWLNANPGNYQDTFLLTPHMSKKVFLYTFCDHEFQMEAANAAEVLDGLRVQIEQEKASPTVYPDLSEWCMVFFGDSVIVYNAGSCSLPGVVEGLSGAQVYNCGQGGVSASKGPNAVLSLDAMITHFLEETPFGQGGVQDYDQGLTKYLAEKHDGKKYCFVINFGLNDYFSGYAPDDPSDPYNVGTFGGALRNGIRKLKENFPEAEIMITTPTYVTLFSGGTEKQGEKGGVLKEYVDLAVSISEEMGVCCVNNYVISGINENNWPQYLADGCHPNETGAFLLGGYIMQELERVTSEN